MDEHHGRHVTKTVTVTHHGGGHGGGGGGITYEEFESFKKRAEQEEDNLKSKNKRLQHELEEMEELCCSKDLEINQWRMKHKKS